MITSGRQYAASQKQLAMLSEAVQARTQEDLPEVIKETGQAQLQSLIEDIGAEIREYEALKASSPEELEIHSIQDLMVTPIRYRIASHMSVDAFSRKVGVSARQILRYEAECYSNTSTPTLTKILEKIDT